LLDSLIWVRAIHFASTMMVAGGIIFSVFIAEPAFRAAGNSGRIATVARSRLDPIAWLCLGLSLFSGMAWLVLMSERMSELPLREAIAQGAAWTVLSDTDFGHDCMVRCLLAALCAATLVWRKFAAHSLQVEALAIVLASGLIGTLAWTGHAAATIGVAGTFHLPSDVLHLIAAAAWVGALIPLALVLHAARSEADDTSVTVACNAVSRFGVLGVFSVGTLLSTGIVNSWVLTGSISALLGSDYGRLLIAKVALFLIMLTVVMVNRLRFTPCLVNGSSPHVTKNALRQIERNSLIEVSVGAMVIVIVSVLGTMAPEMP
jgi:copper resistance protein D